MTWTKWALAAVIVVAVTYAVIRRFRRAGGVLAIPSESENRSTTSGAGPLNVPQALVYPADTLPRND